MRVMVVTACLYAFLFVECSEQKVVQSPVHSKEYMCVAFVVHVANVYADEWMTGEGIPSSKRDQARTMYRQELEEEGKMFECYSYCLTSVSQTEAECATLATSSTGVDRCLNDTTAL